MAEVQGKYELIKALQDASARFGNSPKVSVGVGYSAPYATPVHERLEVYHAPPTQAKFLETPLRENEKKYQAMIENEVLHGRTLVEALMVAGIELQFDSQALCPVDTGHLRASAYTQVEEG